MEHLFLGQEIGCYNPCMSTENDTQMSDFDSPWKEIIEHYFVEFMQFFFPVAYEGIDWQRGYTFLDKELQKVVRDAETKRRQVDKLVQVYEKEGGAEAWVLIHIEVQSQTSQAFSQRMFIYNYRLFDRYAKEVVSFAILSDDSPTWRPSHFGYEKWGCKMWLDFPIAKLLDYKED